MLRLLIVDDQPASLEMMRIALAADPRLVVAGLARSGLEALALTSRAPFDVALVDVHMPDMDGFVTSQRLREQLPALKVIFVSADIGLVYQDLARAYGGLGYLAKRQFSAAAVASLLFGPPRTPGPSGTSGARAGQAPSAKSSAEPST